MKLLAGFLVFFTLFFGGTAAYYHDKTVGLEDSLELSEAIYATSACGDRFSVPIQKGAKFVVAERVVEADDLKNFVQRESGDGTGVEIATRTMDGGWTVLVHRPKK